MRITRICSVTDLGLEPVRRPSSSTTRASSLPIVSLRPETTSSVIGAIVRMCRGGERSGGVEKYRTGGRERLEGRRDGEMEGKET